MKLKNDMLICMYIINKAVLNKFIPDKLFKFLNWNVEHLEAAVAAAATQ